MAILELLLAFIARAVGCYGYHHWTIYTLLIETNPITSYIPVNVIGTAREKLWYEKKIYSTKSHKNYTTSDDTAIANGAVDAEINNAAHTDGTASVLGEPTYLRGLL